MLKQNRKKQEFPKVFRGKLKLTRKSIDPYLIFEP